jgi:hypothetical protein
MQDSEDLQAEPTAGRLVVLRMKGLQRPIRVPAAIFGDYRSSSSESRTVT